VQPYCQKYWYAVHSKACQEHTVKDVLFSHGTECYHPVFRPSGKRRPREAHPKPFLHVISWVQIRYGMPVDVTLVPLVLEEWMRRP
jgi:hypothetical protein